ncbi:MAG: 2OG-Fe(II) oxygenase [Novosphingobium sp.]
MAGIEVFDHILDEVSHHTLWDLLAAPGWKFGAYSDSAADAPRYYYKHFAGYSSSGIEARDPAGIAGELRANCAPLHRMWQGIVQALLPGQWLSRCYANSMPPGVGGGIHRDSLDPAHLTLIYYPQLAWSPEEGGETLFFDESETRVIGRVEPRPNRLAVFPGVIPHRAEPIGVDAPANRITLMFKTLGRCGAGQAGSVGHDR